MRVLILGGTGFIGEAVVRALVTAGHDVCALARSDGARRTLAALGASPIAGDIRAPEAWAGAVLEVDALIHAAGIFSDEMAEIDARLLQAIEAVAARRSDRLRMLYTGGCWLYGDTGGQIATEESPYNPIPAFRYMVDGVARLQNAAGIAPLVIHPGMTYARGDGVLARFVESARRSGRIEVWGGLDAHWPVVHRDDLADAYRLVLETAPDGETYIAVSEPGVRVGDIVARIQVRFGLDQAPFIRNSKDVMAEHGAWALGPTIDQRLSSQKLRRRLGWRPEHANILDEAP